MSNNDDDWLLEILVNVFQWGEEQEYESDIHVLLFIIQPKKCKIFNSRPFVTSLVSPLVIGSLPLLKNL